MTSSMATEMDDEPLTYEASRARQSTFNQPDKIHWDREYAFRGSSYRLLHHQKGLIGTFRLQLLEAKDLERSYWSALALGPVKHLGLSKAHGNVSSYCSLELQFPTEQTNERDQKPAAASVKYTSPVVPNHNSPVWPHCEWDVPLKKGIKDGTPIILHIEAIEESSAADSVGLPLVPSGDDRVLGTGDLDITTLCLGQLKGQTHVGVMDSWVEIKKKGVPRGKVRVLVSYATNGLKPQPNDLVALEAFARRNVARASCNSILPSLLPMRVLQEEGGHLLVEYRMRNGERATLRVHRKAVFVIERFNVVDGAVNLALAPADFVLSTPIGRAAQSVAGPVLEGAGELVMPAVLSFKILWGAVRTTGFAALSGVAAATGAVMQESRESHENRQRKKAFAVHV